MKEYTNISHKRPDGEECNNKLSKEYWGTNKSGQSQWHMTCYCGFNRIIPEEEFLKWQYCDRVIYD